MEFLRKIIASLLLLSGISFGHAKAPLLTDGKNQAIWDTAHTDTSFTPAIANKSTSQAQLVPFDIEKHGKQARRLHSQYGHIFGNIPPCLYEDMDLIQVQVLIQNGKVIGLIIYHDCENYDNTIIRYIHQVCIAPALRNKSYGSQLMTQFEKMSEKQGIEHLMLAPVDRSFPFYTRLGFELTGTFTKYGAPEMFKSLTAAPLTMHASQVA